VENLYGYYMVLRDPPTKSFMLSAHILVFRMREFVQYLEAILQPLNMISMINRVYSLNTKMKTKTGCLVQRLKYPDSDVHFQFSTTRNSMRWQFAHPIG